MTTPVGTWRDLETGVDPYWHSWEDADGATDQAGTPPEPIYTRVEGPYGLPWWDALENVDAETGLFSSPNPLDWSPREDEGAVAIVGAFEGAFQTNGPIVRFGHEVSGGMVDTDYGIAMGDQMIGRIMRFPANIPERYDPNGVYSGADYRDELVALIANGNAPIVSEAEVTTQLTLWPNVSQY